MKKIKILVILESAGLEYGGPAISLPPILKDLIENFDVTLLSCKAEVPINHTKKLLIKEFPFLKIGKYRLSPGMYFYLIKNIRKYDIVHVNNLWNLFFIIPSFLAILTKRKLVVSPRGALKDEAIRHLQWIKVLAFKTYVRLVLNAASVVHFTDESEKSSKLASHIKSRCVVIPNGVRHLQKDNINVDNSNLNRGLNFLFLSRILEHKGLDIGLKAFVNSDATQSKFIIAGPIEDHTYFQYCMQSALGMPNVKYVGPVSGKVKDNLLLSSDVLIMPTKSESFGMSIAEALANKTIVLCSGNLIWRKVADNHSIIWTERNVESFKNEINNLSLKSRSEISKMKETAPEKVIEYSAKSICKKYRNLYFSVLNG